MATPKLKKANSIYEESERERAGHLILISTSVLEGARRWPHPFSYFEGEWPSPPPLKKNKKNGGGHLPIPSRKNSHHGDDQPSLSLFVFLDLYLSLLSEIRKGVAVSSPHEKIRRMDVAITQPLKG